MIKFKHYKPNGGKYNEPMYGILFVGGKYPVFDVYLGKHVFTWFWRKNERSKKG